MDSVVGRRPTAPPAPKGLYIYGNVGSGMLMYLNMCFLCKENVCQLQSEFGSIQERQCLWTCFIVPLKELLSIEEDITFMR